MFVAACGDDSTANSDDSVADDEVDGSEGEGEGETGEGETDEGNPGESDTGDDDEGETTGDGAALKAATAFRSPPHDTSCASQPGAAGRRCSLVLA